MDMHTIDLEPYQYSDAYILGIRLVDPKNPMMSCIKNALEPGYEGDRFYPGGVFGRNDEDEEIAEKDDKHDKEDSCETVEVIN